MRCRSDVLACRALLLVVLLFPGGLFAEKEKPAADSSDIEIVGQIVPADVPDKERRHPCKIHTLAFEKDKAYVIDLMSRDFDCWLRIADGDGKTLVQDDDGGEGLNSRIRFTAPQGGVYQVVATSFSGGGGAYALKVRLEGRNGAATKPAAKPSR